MYHYHIEKEYFCYIPQILPRILVWASLSCLLLYWALVPGSQCWLHLSVWRWTAVVNYKQNKHINRNFRGHFNTHSDVHPLPQHTHIQKINLIGSFCLFYLLHFSSIPVWGALLCHFSPPWGFSCSDPPGQPGCRTSHLPPRHTYRPAGDKHQQQLNYKTQLQDYVTKLHKWWPANRT